MRIAYATTFAANDMHNWSGTPFHMSHALQQASLNVHYIGDLKRKLPRFFKAKQVISKYIRNQRESPRFNIYAAQHYSRQVAEKLKLINADVVVSPLINPVAYLDCKQPIVIWTDALYAALVGFYEPFSTHSTATISAGNAITRACVARSAKLIFSSDWAANSAIELYSAHPDKVCVLPFGANMTTHPSTECVNNFIDTRPKNKINLLFLAKSWQRKGGDKVLAVAEQLHRNGYAVELNIVGYDPPLKTIPSYVNCLGFISKHNEEGKNRLQQLFAETHFLFVPSIAEAYGIVFCEANAYGIPCLTSYVGGINTIIKNGINGIKFSLDASIDDYCKEIIKYTHDHKLYKDFARSSHNEFITRLNWNVSAEKFKKLLTEL